MLHVSSLVVSLACHHEHLRFLSLDFIFLIHSSCYDTRTRSTIGTTRATPRTPSTSRTCPSSFDKLRHEESLWREDLQSGGNPRTTTPTDAGLKLVEQWQDFSYLETEEGQQMQHLCREFTLPRNEEGTCVIGWILKNTRNGPLSNINGCYHDDRHSIEVQIPSLFALLGLESWMVLRKK